MRLRMKLELRKQKQNERKCNQTLESRNCLGLPYAQAEASIRTDIQRAASRNCDAQQC